MQITLLEQLLTNDAPSYSRPRSHCGNSCLKIVVKLINACTVSKLNTCDAEPETNGIESSNDAASTTYIYFHVELYYSGFLHHSAENPDASMFSERLTVVPERSASELVGPAFEERHDFVLGN